MVLTRSYGAKQACTSLASTSSCMLLPSVSLTPICASSVFIVTISCSCGILRRRSGSAVSRDAARIGSAAFLAPEARISPWSCAPPSIRNLSIRTSFTQHRDRRHATALAGAKACQQFERWKRQAGKTADRVCGFRGGNIMHRLPRHPTGENRDLRSDRRHGLAAVGFSVARLHVAARQRHRGPSPRTPTVHADGSATGRRRPAT